MVALGTVADVVKLDRNNRVLVHQGLRRIRAGRACPLVAALFRTAGRDPLRASTYDLGFVAGPRLNAAGRLDDMAVGIEGLTTDDPTRAASIAEQLDELNRTRRVIEQDMQEGALTQHWSALRLKAALHWRCSMRVGTRAWSVCSLRASRIACIVR